MNISKSAVLFPHGTVAYLNIHCTIKRVLLRSASLWDIASNPCYITITHSDKSRPERINLTR